MTEETASDFEMGREQNEVVQGMDSLARGINALVTALEKKPQTALFELLDGTPVTARVRMRVSSAWISTNAAGNITLQVGTRQFTWYQLDVKHLPFPITIEKGTDVTVSVGGGNCFGWLIYEPIE